MKTMKQNGAGRMAGVLLVGQFNGARHIRWAAACLLGFGLGIFGGAFAVGVYFALSGTFSPAVGLIGFFGPFITVGTGVQRACKLPVEDLTPIGV